jgi:hypothetical protein
MTEDQITEKEWTSFTDACLRLLDMVHPYNMLMPNHSGLCGNLFNIQQQECHCIRSNFDGSAYVIMKNLLSPAEYAGLGPEGVMTEDRLTFLLWLTTLTLEDYRRFL